MIDLVTILRDPVLTKKRALFENILTGGELDKLTMLKGLYLNDQLTPTDREILLFVAADKNMKTLLREWENPSGPPKEVEPGKRRREGMPGVRKSRK